MISIKENVRMFVSIVAAGGMVMFANNNLGVRVGDYVVQVLNNDKKIGASAGSVSDQVARDFVRFTADGVEIALATGVMYVGLGIIKRRKDRT